MDKKILATLLCTIMYVSASEKTVNIDIEGMTCPLCTMTIKKNLKKQPGVQKAKVRLNTHTATVTYETEQIETSRLLKAIEAVGYKGKIKEK